MSAQPEEERHRRADTVRLIVTRRERAPRSPRMARALKRLIWRYLSLEEAAVAPEAAVASEAAGTPDGPDAAQAEDR